MHLTPVPSTVNLQQASACCAPFLYPVFQHPSCPAFVVAQCVVRFPKSQVPVAPHPSYQTRGRTLMPLLASQFSILIEGKEGKSKTKES